MDWIPIDKYLDYYVKIPQKVKATFSTTEKLEVTQYRKLRDGFKSLFELAVNVKLSSVEFPDLHTVEIQFDVDSSTNQKKLGNIIPPTIFGIDQPGFEDTLFQLNQIWTATGVTVKPDTGNYGAPTLTNQLEDVWFWVKIIVVVVGIYSLAKLFREVGRIG